MIGEIHVTVQPGPGLGDLATTHDVKLIMVASLVDVQVMFAWVDAAETLDELVAGMRARVDAIALHYPVLRSKLEILAPAPRTCLYEELHLTVSMPLLQALSVAPPGCHVSQNLRSGKVIVTTREAFTQARERYAPWTTRTQHEYCVLDSNVALDAVWMGARL